MRHRDGEDDHRVHVLLALEHLARCRRQRGVTQRQIVSRVSLVEHRVVRAVLGAAEVAVALEPREPAANGRVALALEPRRVRRRPPPGRLDRLPAVRGHDQVDADLVAAPSRAATTPACSRSGSRGRPRTRPRGSSAPSCRQVIRSRVMKAPVKRKPGRKSEIALSCRMRISFLIPTFNEAATIIEVLRKRDRGARGRSPVIVVDDGLDGRHVRPTEEWEPKSPDDRPRPTGERRQGGRDPGGDPEHHRRHGHPDADMDYDPADAAPSSSRSNAAESFGTGIVAWLALTDGLLTRERVPEDPVCLVADGNGRLLEPRAVRVMSTPYNSARSGTRHISGLPP